uniref:Uncharacterized protein n=1 Tax=Ditylenchus dipsaci TaxID=166011 RepID=A0A915EK62_9BILA
MYVERLKALEAVLQGLEEVTDIVRRHEITLSSFDDLPAALDKLRGVHSQLIELNMVLQQQQEYVQTLNKNVAQLRQHVARTRFNVSSHPDVDRLEEAVQNITVRWDNVCSQVAERLKTAEETQQTQMIYRSQYDEEILWLDRVESTINSLRRPEDLRPEELQSQLDQLVAEYAQLQEHTATIENINKEGGKFIRDAKSYDIRLNQFHDNVITTHGPGIRSEFRRQIPQSKNGAQIVTEELEALNRRFAQLSSVILERKNIVNVLIQNWRRKQQEDEDRRRAEEEEKRRAFEAARRKALDEADRLRRDREAAEAARRAADEADRLRRQQAEAEAARRAAEDAERRRREEEERRRREAEDAERRRREEEERNRRPKEPVVNVANTYQQADQHDDFDSFENLGEVPVVAKITEHEDEPQMFQEETVTKTQFYEMEGILHKQTGEILTFVEAIRQGLLDLSQGGEFFDIMSGSRVSLEKAAEMGLINQNISDILNGRHGIRHPDTGEEITLLEAIQIGLYDPDSRQLRDIKTGEILSLFDCVSRGICNTTTQHRLIKMGVLKLPPMALEQALKNGVLNPLTGEFRGKYVTEPIPLRDALANGYIQFSSQTPIIAVTLSDCIEDGLIDAYSGEFVDKNVQGEKFTLRDALERNKELIRDNIREVVNTDTNQRITLQEAILCHAINPRQGKFTDLQSRANLSLRQAFDQALISKPKTLTEIIDQGQLDTSNHFLDRGNRYTLVEAINAGVVDPEVRHIVDKNAQDVISIVEALERGVLSPAGKIVQEWGSDGREARSLDLYEAHRQGLLTKRVRHTIFDVKGIKNSQNNTNLSFNEAVEAGAFDIQSERVVDLQSKNTYLLSDAVGFVNEPDLSLVRAVGKGLVDASKGVLYDKRSQRELTASQAYQQGIVSLKGALRLAALFDVHPLLMTPIKKRQQNKRIRRPGQSGAPLPEDQIKVTLSEAMKQGLIDSRTQRFRQGGQEMSLDDALSQGLIDPSSEWIVPSRASAVGPTIEEKTQETITETGQQLAPKIYPDKQLEETVNTVKRVKRTETSAVGGPGGVSVYRAITGGKEQLKCQQLDTISGVVSPPGTNKTLTVEEAFNLGILNPNCVTIRDPKSGRQLNAVEALEQKVMDKHGFVDNRGRRLTLQEAIDERVAHVEAEPLVPSHAGHKKVIQFSSAHGPVTSFRPVGQPVIEEHEQSWTFDSSVGHLVDASTGERISLDSAIQSGKLAPEDLRVRDALTGREMSLDEAQKWGIVNLRDGYYLDKTDNKRYSLQEAARQHKLYPTGGVPENAGDAVHTTVKIQTRSEISKKEAVPIGGSGAHSIGDFNIGKLVDLKLYNASSGLFNHPSDSQAKQMTLKELIVKGFLNPYTTSILDKRQGKHLKLLDAIEQHLVDDIAGTVTDTQTGRVHDLQSAMREVGYPSNQGGHSPKLVERKLQLTPYAQEPSYHREEVTSTSSVRQRQPSPSGFVRSQVERVERSGPSGGTSGGFSNAMISHQPFGASHGMQRRW